MILITSLARTVCQRKQQQQKKRPVKRWEANSILKRHFSESLSPQQPLPSSRNLVKLPYPTRVVGRLVVKERDDPLEYFGKRNDRDDDGQTSNPCLVPETQRTEPECRPRLLLSQKSLFFLTRAQKYLLSLLHQLRSRNNKLLLCMNPSTPYRHCQHNSGATKRCQRTTSSNWDEKRTHFTPNSTSFGHF